MLCEVCKAQHGDFTLDLGSHPLCDDLTPIGTDFVIPKYRQLIALCENCLTAHQVIPVEKELLFKPTYHYRAALTQDVLDGMRALVKDLSSVFSNLDEPATILDVGCNDGSLLGIFKEEYNCRTIGVDPTGAILESGNRIDYRFNEYFTSEVAASIKKNHSNIDLISFTNVFAHIEDLPQLLVNLTTLIGDDTALVIENHYLGSILERNQFDTFYHEHPRTYSLKSFEFIAESLGLVIVNVTFPSRYGGNIRVTMKKNGMPADLSLPRIKETSFIESFNSLQAIYDSWRSEAQETLSALYTQGIVHGKSLPGRAVMLINALGIDESTMPIVFEQPKSPKVGNYIPGTKIEVLSDSALLSHEPTILIVWSWHIIKEVVEYLDTLGYRGEIWVPLPKFEMYRAAL
jgi:SAM-dependent methyltransferase